MKKLFTQLALLTALLIAFTPRATAQLCEIDTNNFEFITPPSDDLPCVVRNQPYVTTIQFFCPPSIAGISIDSIKVTGFSGLPTGITYACNPPICKAYPFDRLCIGITGTTPDTVGEYDIVYSGSAYTSQGTFSLTGLQNQGFLPKYSFLVIDSNDLCRGQDTTQDTTVGIFNLNPTGPKVSVFPNPSNGKIQVELRGQSDIVGEIIISNLLGAVVYRQPVATGANYRTVIDLGGQSKGVYILQVQSTNGLSTRRISLE